MVSTRVASGGWTAQANQPRTQAFGRLHKTNAPGIGGVIFQAGIGSIDTRILTDDPHRPVTKALTDHGFAVGACKMEETWGNAIGTQRVTDLRADGRANFGWPAVALYGVGFSMGATVLLNWAKANPGVFKALALAIPAVDTQDIYDNDRNGYRASITAAWGGRPANADTPARNSGAFVDLPITIWYSDNDPICVSAVVTAFASAVGATAHSLGAIGHSPAGISAEEVVSLFEAHP